MERAGPLLARALALSRWPELRTPEEQAALDAWLEDSIERGLADWTKLAEDMKNGT